MGAERAGRRRPLVRRIALLSCGGVLLSACASMPSSGEPEPVDASPNKPKVRVFAAPPKDDAQPGEIIDGFLETLTGDDPDFSIARKYLTADAAKDWDPDSSTTILADGPKAGPQKPEQGQGQDSQSRTYQLTGTRVATLDADHAYRPELEAPDYAEAIQLVKEGKKGNEQWRIASPPQGVVLGEPDFQRLYKPVDKYYYASGDSRGDEANPPSDPLVADPVYVRGDPDPQLTDVVEELLAGPTNWLDTVVSSRFPSGTALRKGTKELTPDDQKHLRVPLNKKADDIGQDRCKEMAAQIYFTLNNLTAPSGIDQVELLRSDGASSLCVLGRSEAQTFAPDAAAKPKSQYFVDKKHRLVQISKGAEEPTAVPGALGEGKQELRSAAVSRNEKWGAGVSGDGRSLFIGALIDKTQSEKTQVTSTAEKEGDRLTAPSWDGRGDLWVADADPKKPRLLWLAKGQGEPVEVGFDRPLGKDGIGRVKAVRVAADGVRIALLIEKDGRTTLNVGRIERGSKGGVPQLTVAELRPAAPKMEEVTAVSWAGGSRLLLVGRAVEGVQQMRFVQSDGSLLPDEPTLPGLADVTAVSAAEAPDLPLVARSETDGIVRLVDGEDWKPVDKDGTAPVYPG